MLLLPAFFLFVTLSPLLETNSSLCSTSKLPESNQPHLQLSSSQWVERSKCSDDELFDANNTNFWLSKHTDELANGTFKLLVRQKSLDARRSDLIYLVATQMIGSDFGHYKFNSGNLQQDLINQKLAAGARVDDEACRRHLEQMLELLDDLNDRVGRMRQLDLSHKGNERALDERHFRLALQLDSFGRYESGQFGGKLHSFGTYNQCIRTQLLLTNGTGEASGRTLIDSRYCWAHLGIAERLSEPLRDQAKKSMATSSQGNSSGFHMAVCLPATCHSATFTSNPATLRLVQRLVDSQFLAPESMYLDKSLPVESVFCLVDDDSQLAAMSLAGKLFIIFITLWLLICTCATYASAASKNQNDNLLSQLDLGESWRDFLGKSEGRSKNHSVDFSTLNLINPLSGSALFLVHAGIIIASLNEAPIQLEASLVMSRVQRLTLPSLLLVDSFFVLFWMKVTFVLLEKLDQSYGHNSTRWRQTKFNLRHFCKLWLYISVRLSSRLIPLYFLMFWFKKSLYFQLGSGPLWDFGLNRATSMGACRQEDWLSPVTCLAAVTEPTILSQCLPQGWLISNGLLFALILPPIIILLRGNSRLAYALALLTTATSLSLGYWTYSTMEPKALKSQLERFQLAAVLNVFKLASYIYTNPFNRLPVAMVGVLAGHALFGYERKRSQDGTETATSSLDAWPRWFRRFATSNAISFAVVSLLMSFLVHEIGQVTSLEFKKTLMNHFVLSGHLNWALANAVIFLRLATDWRNRSYVLSLASSKLFQAVSRLTLALWLLHWDMLVYGVQTGGQSQSWNYAKAISMALVNMIAISLLVHVCFENPANKLIKALWSRKLSPMKRLAGS